jgi:hypothetical protein
LATGTAIQSREVPPFECPLKAWSFAKTGWVRHEVFDSLWRAAAAKVQSLNAQGLANTLGAMANMSRVLPEVFDSLCRAAAAKLQDSNMQEVAYALWAV